MGKTDVGPYRGKETEMNCTEFRQAVRQLPGRTPPQGELAGHLSGCELCRHYYGDLLLERELAALQVPEPSSGFLQRAIDHAAAQTPAWPDAGELRHRRWPAALAASVMAAVLGVALWLSVPTTDNGADLLVESMPGQADYHREEVRIVIYSSEEREDAELTIELAESLELEGFAGERQLAWNTRLSKGANVLTLPVLVRNSGGQVRVRSRFGGMTHEVSINVVREDDSV